MTTYKNTKASLDADCTVICYAQGNKPEGEHWVECDESEIGKFKSLYVQAGTRYFGRM